MPLNTTKLKQDLKNAFEAQVENDNREDALTKLSADLTTAIEAFVKSATVNAGIPVTTSNSTGSTSGTGTLS